jgi:hypothetical protein
MPRLPKGDPKQALQEGSEILLAFCIGAARECRKQNPGVPVNAAMVQAHMAARAAEEPLVLMVGLWMR